MTPTSSASARPARRPVRTARRTTTPAATAYTIRALHSGVHAAVTARKKSLALLYTFIICFIYKVVTGYAPGLIFDWHIGWTLYRLGFTSIIALDNYGWWIECESHKIEFVSSVF